jgi:pyruvate dehydrogenase E2 component (dihydrolipoamide acetyltransferase)
MPEWVFMPKLGVNMTEGVIVSWLVEEGEAVKRGQPLLEIETDKATQEVEATQDGVLAKILFPVGTTIPCTYTIAVITSEGEELPAEIPERDEAGSVPVASFDTSSEPKAASVPKSAAVSTSSGPVRISPAAKKLARELGVDYTLLQGSGGKGRIQKSDVLAAAEDKKAAPSKASAPPQDLPSAGAVVPLEGVRAIIAERMQASTQTTARVTLMLHADATQLVAWRDQLRQDYPEKAARIGYNELLVMIVAKLLREFPNMNAAIHGNEIRLLEEINVGVAVDTERGLLVPVIKAADQKDVFELHTEFDRVVEQALAGRSQPDDLGGGTFTITNLGMYEIEEFTPVINLPEAAILGVGMIVPTPVAVKDQVVIQPRMALSLAFDHRVVDGAPAARFLQRIKHLIEAPVVLNSM